jgi:hypothetical protein
MAQVIFNNRIDMVTTAATPSADGYTIGYDTDGVIKQKDYLGVVTPLFSSSSQNLIQTLNLGNDSGIYSIMMGTGTSIYSSNSNGKIKLDYNNSVFIYTTASSTGTASIQIENSNINIFNSQQNKYGSLQLSGNTYSVEIGSLTGSVMLKQTNSNISIKHKNKDAVEDTISVIEIGSSYDGDTVDNKAYVHINSKNATTNSGVRNSVIIGGQGLVSSTNDTVYLGNNVNINNAYTLPNVVGNSNQYLKTLGNGTTIWEDISASNPSLSEVLAVGNNSATYNIVLGSGTSIKSDNGYSSIQLDSQSTSGKILISTDGSVKSKSYIEIDNSDLLISATSSIITTGDLKGFQYSTDYSSTFVNNSLVTKQYVDSKLVSTFTAYKIAYVDPTKGSDITGVVERVDKPFATVEKAMSGLTSSYSFSTSDPGLVYLKKGLYTNTVYLKNNIDFYCEPDVIFSQNGFTDINEVVNSSIYGFAKFVGTNTNLVPLDVTNASNIEFNFSVIDNQNVVLKVTNTSGKSTIKLKGDSIQCKSGFSKAILIGSNAGNVDVYSDVKIDVSGKIIGAYNTINVSNKFIGTLEVNANSIECNSNLNTNGPIIDLQHALLVKSASASVRINADLIENSSSNAGGFNAAVSICSGTVSIIGNISGLECPGVYLYKENLLDTANVSISGNIISKKEAIINEGGKLNFKVNNSLIKTSGLGTNPYAININAASMSSTYLYNTQIYNSLNNSGSILISATESNLRIYNSFGYSPGTSGKFIYCSATTSVSIHNTRSNKDNSDNVEDLFTPSGFIYDQNLYLGDF